jgi:catechol 2,3-dioxygenase-like lactoylglutathione lyase family enzyme
MSRSVDHSREIQSMIQSIAHVCLAATDLAATERFYTLGLGFKKHFDFLRGGKLVGFYFEVAPMNYVEVFRQDDVTPDGKCPIRHVCFQTDDIDAVAKRLRDHGYEASPTRRGGDQSWQIWTNDPAGVRIEFHQYTDKSSQLTRNDCVLG